MNIKFYMFFKRLFDILFSTVFIVLLFIPCLIISLIIKVDSKGPVFFKQKRIGKDGKVFNCLKFRTMFVGAEKQGVYTNEKDSRVTRFGKFLRKLSIDEFPQLLNIFAGQMSFVGPRPVLTYHPFPFENYSPKQKEMFRVRPGLTGWAQINGRKNVEWDKRIRLNVWYANNISFLLDLKIFVLTFAYIFHFSDNYNNKINYLKLFLITNSKSTIKSANKYGVDRIFIDMEYIGKEERQKGLDTVKNHHTIKDVQIARKLVSRSDLLVRINPIYSGTRDEIDESIRAGADFIMLPMFKTVDEVKTFINFVDKRAKTIILLETKEAVSLLDSVLSLEGIDELYIGLNDLHLSLKQNFMFEPLATGMVENICNKCKEKGISYGFGGISKIGDGLLPSQFIIAEHKKLGSSMAILSRGFLAGCNSNSEVKKTIKNEISKIRKYELFLSKQDDAFFEKNEKETFNKINQISKREAA